MTSDHDKLLAQGPRVAPEPVSADGFASPVATAGPAPFDLFGERPVAATEPTDMKPPLVKPRAQRSRSGSSGSWLTGPLLRRLIPLMLVLVVVGQRFAQGHSGSWTFALVWIVAAVVIVALRTRGRRPW